jgi:hypothetical protein
MKEDPRRHEAERRQARSRHGADSDRRLSAPGRKNDGTTATGGVPQLQRRLLVVSQLRTRERLVRRSDVCRRFVRDLDTLRPQLGNERGAAVGWNSVNSNPRVPENARNCREIEGITILREHDGAPVEGQAHVA